MSVLQNHPEMMFCWWDVEAEGCRSGEVGRGAGDEEVEKGGGDEEVGREV